MLLIGSVTNKVLTQAKTPVPVSVKVRPGLPGSLACDPCDRRIRNRQAVQSHASGRRGVGAV
jgi:hypothetical protein